jgi:hypothetical protein
VQESAQITVPDPFILVSATLLSVKDIICRRFRPMRLRLGAASFSVSVTTENEKQVSVGSEKTGK